MILPDTPAAQLSIEYGFMGPSMSITAACATGTNAVGEAFEMIARDAADVVIAGGTDSLLIPVVFAGFCIMKAFSTRNDDPQHACRPFDLNRDGFVASEGAAVLILESLEHAQARGARIYAEMIGYGTSVDAQSMVAPLEDGRGASLAMKAAIRRAGIEPTEVDYLNAHGTSTPLNDVAETNAIKTALGEHAYDLAISSTKSMTGHLLGGAGALEALVCVKTLETGTIPPTINYETPDPECDLDYTPNSPRQADIDVAMSNSFGFGGHNATVILRRYRNGRNGHHREIN
jgi:3-oxoacyl-[acyl-carrier-protein] synthase II